MKKYIYLQAISMLIISLLTGGCTKEILDKKPNQSQVVPTTIADFQALLDNKLEFADNNINIAEIGAGDFYVSYTDYQTLASLPERNSYTWQKDIWQGETSVPAWDAEYQKVFYANVALEGLQKVAVNPGNQVAYNNTKGMALYERANAFFNIAQQFAKPYDAATAGTGPGIPLRLTADLNVRSVRATVKETYDQITNDLKQSAVLLPASSGTQQRPGKAAAYGLLSRVYLSIGSFDLAFKNADASLKLFSTLLDYNTLDTSAEYPMTYLNIEVVNFNDIPNSPILNPVRANIDPDLYNSYAENDLRRTIFYNTRPDGTAVFAGSYWGVIYLLFSGITTDEQFLIRAECSARAGQTAAAMADLNALLKMRFVTGTFSPYIAASAEDALKQIITERRKELIMRGLRWSDLRRLNKDPRFAVTLSRDLNGITYTLPPDDRRYVLPIPDYIIKATGMQQNQR